MMQRGHMILCGNGGHGLGDSMYDGIIIRQREVESTRHECVPGGWDERGHRVHRAEVPHSRARLRRRPSRS